MTLSNSSSHEKVRSIIVYSLYGAAFFMPLHLIITEFFVVIAALAAIVHTCLNGKNLWRRSPLTIAAFGFAVAAFLSINASPNKWFSFFNFCITVVQYILIYSLTVSFIRGERERRNALYAFLGGAVCVALYGLCQYSFLTDITMHDWVDPNSFPLLKRRMYSTLYNPNLLSAYLLMVMGVSAAFTIWTKQKYHRYMYGALFALSTLCLVLTYSRGAWVSVLAMIFFFGLVWEKKLWLLFLPFLLVLIFYHGGIAARFFSMFSQTDTSTTLRFALWDSTLYMIQDHPFFGIGWDAYWLVYPEYNYFIQDASIIIFHAHNMYLNLAAETGFTGCFFYLWFFFGHGWYGMKFLNNDHSPFSRSIAMGMVAIICSIAISGLSDYDLFAIQVSLCFWFLCGIFANVYVENKEEKLIA